MNKRDSKSDYTWNTKIITYIISVYILSHTIMIVAWVLMSMEEYDKMVQLGFEPDEATPEEIKAYQESSHGKDWVEDFPF